MTPNEIIKQLETKTGTEVAKEAGLPPSKIYNLYRKVTGKKLLRSRLGKERLLNSYGKGIARIKKMQKLRDKGVSYEDIGKLQTPTISRQRVQQILKTSY